MSEQARKVKNKAIPEWAEGLYYNSGMFSEILVYHDDESIYIEHKGKESGIVRFTFEMIEGLKIVEEEQSANSTLATVARVAIIVYAVFAALTQLGIAVQLTANTLLIVLVGVALATALAFGFGAQNVARDIVERAYDRRRDGVRGEPTVRESSTQRESVPRTRRLHREEEV
jgi:hypothetical protein